MLDKVNNASFNKATSEVKSQIKTEPHPSAPEDHHAGGASKVGELKQRSSLIRLRLLRSLPPEDQKAIRDAQEERALREKYNYILPNLPP